VSATKPIVVIELYDSGVRISDGENILAESISCALIESHSSILVGEQAEHQAHLRPREISISFWGQLSKNSETKHVVSNAEIALQHLQHVWSSASCSTHSAILVTPITLDKHDLGLLLGICKKLSIDVASIVCNATLAMQYHIATSKAVFLDLLQQSFAMTEIKQSNGGVSLKQPSRVINYGLQSFINNAAQAIANKFIAETRFDPLHNANDEQQFFDVLPLWLKMLQENEFIECKLNTSEKHFSVDVDKQLLQQANQKLFDEIAAHLNVLFHDHERIALFCSSPCKQAFGLHEFLNKLPGCAIVQLEKKSMARHALHCSSELISDDQVHYVNALSWLESSITEKLHFNPGRLSNLTSQPTHLLIDGHAYSLKQDIFIDSDDTAKPRVTMERSNQALCKISTNNMNVEIQVFAKRSVNVNRNSIETIATANIGDVLAIENYQTDYIFIKVVQDET